MSHSNTARISEREAATYAEFQELAASIRSLHRRVLDVEPGAGSLLANMDRQTRVAPLSYGVKLQLQVAANHLDLVVSDAHRDCVVQDAGYSLLRGALEAAVTAGWMLLPGAKGKRMYSSLLVAWWHQGDTDRFASTTNRPDYSADLERIRGLLEADRARTRGIQHETLDIPRVHRTAMIKEVDEKLTTKPLPSVEAAWRMCSGFAHGNQPLAGSRSNCARSRRTIPTSTVQPHARKSLLLSFAQLCFWRPTRSNVSKHSRSHASLRRNARNSAPRKASVTRTVDLTETEARQDR